MTRRKWRIERMMVVPAQWQGSVEHFYHFLLGYFVPLVLWQEKTGTEQFSVRDCGPMNPWFDLLRPGSDIQFLPPGVMLERYLSHRQERQVLHDWDNPTKFHSTSLLQVHRTVLARTCPLGLVSESKQSRITVINRRDGSSFYRDAKSEVHGSAADVRSVPNMEDVADALALLGKVQIADPASMTPSEQTQLFAQTDVLVAQHGAGLSNMVWLPRNAAVIEIQPPLPPIIDAIFPNLAAALHLDHVIVRQDHEHAKVSPSDVTDCLTKVLAQPEAFVPSPPGRLPTRVLRRMPRRL